MRAEVSRIWVPCVVALLLAAGGANAQEIRNVTFGWGDAVRIGRWTPVFVTVEDAQVRDVDLQVHGTYGEKGEAMWVHQTAVAQPLPVTYALLFPVNAQLAKIVVVVSDLKTGRTLGTQALQVNSAFSPAGKTPMHLLAANDTLIGISGNVDDALRVAAQLGKGEIRAGVLDPMKLPANFAGFDGISALVLAAPDFDELKDEQERAILQWVGRGGVLLLIPPASAIPERSEIVDALPCAIGVNRVAGEKIKLNARELSPRTDLGAGARSFVVEGQTGYRKRLGLGWIAVSPVDFSPVEFPDATAANGFWKSVLEPMVKLPGIEKPTENIVGEEEQIIVSGSNAADTVGRGPRESVAIRHVLELLGAAQPTGGSDWRGALLTLAAIFFLLGPVDSVLLVRLGQHPRNSWTLVGWIGLILSVGIYAIARPIRGTVQTGTFRLVDQVGDTIVGATDIVAIKSRSPMVVPVEFDKNEWWEPANQADRELSADRFVDAECRQDRTGCRPESVKLDGMEPQAWHGEMDGLGAGYLAAELSLSQDAGGAWHLRGKLGNAGKSAMTDIFVETKSGNFRIPGSLAAGATMDVDATASGEPIALDGLANDVGDVAAGRADRVEEMVREGWACVMCQMPEADEVKVGGGVDEHWEVLRAVVGVSPGR